MVIAVVVVVVLDVVGVVVFVVVVVVVVVVVFVVVVVVVVDTSLSCYDLNLVSQLLFIRVIQSDKIKVTFIALAYVVKTF